MKKTLNGSVFKQMILNAAKILELNRQGCPGYYRTLGCLLKAKNASCTLITETSNIIVVKDGVFFIIFQLGSHELAFHDDGDFPNGGNLVLFFVHMNWLVFIRR